MFNRWPLSSVGQSSRLIIDWSLVQVQQGPPDFDKCLLSSVDRAKAVVDSDCEIKRYLRCSMRISSNLIGFQNKPLAQW